MELSANLGPPKKYDVSSKDPDIRKAGLAYCSDLMNAMDALDCRRLIGALNSSWLFDFSDKDKAIFWNNGVENLKTMGNEVESLGIELSLEVLSRFVVLTD